MVNRILIRIKVVQMLYSYLLTRSEFKIEPSSVATSKSKQYAYAVYMRLLQMITELSGLTLVRASGALSPQIISDKILSRNRVGRELAANDSVKDSALDDKTDVSAFDELLPRLVALIVKSSAYKDYKKIKAPTLSDDVKFWIVVINTIIAQDAEVIRVFRNDSDYSIAGMEAGVKMTVETLMSYQDSRMSYANAQRELQFSLDKAYELYFSMFSLMINITREQVMRLESAKAKYLATSEDLNPNLRFVENKFIAAVESNPEYQAYTEQHPITWDGEESMIRTLLDSILNSQIYADYMAAEETGYEDDCDFWRNVFKTIILPSDSLAESLENKSIYWNDDLDIMSTFVIKTIKQFAAAPDGDAHFLPQYKDEEDAAFGAELFSYSVENRDTYRSYIEKFINSSQWDPERLAFMDIVIMTVAIAEFIHYPAIPVPVTMNEYIEIANNYSTQRSGQFINGILFSIVNYLNEEGVILKK